MSARGARPAPDQPRRSTAATHRRARAADRLRHAAHPSNARLIHLNLVPLVGTFASLAFFALATAKDARLATREDPVDRSVGQPAEGVGRTSRSQLTVGIGREITVDGRPLMATMDAVGARFTDPSQPQLIPILYVTLRRTADSIRTANRLVAESPVVAPLAIRADPTTRYDLLARVMHTARLAGFRSLTLQVDRMYDAVPAPTAATRAIGPRST